MREKVIYVLLGMIILVMGYLIIPSAIPPKEIIDSYHELGNTYTDVSNRKSEFYIGYQANKTIRESIEVNVPSDTTEGGDIISSVPDEAVKKVIGFAMAQIGHPYSQALRDDGYHFDCSSLTYYAWKTGGENLQYNGANTAAAQAQGLKVKGKTFSYDISKLKAGDLLFYSRSKNGRFMNITHTALYVGNGEIVDASSSKGMVVHRGIVDVNKIVIVGRP